MLSGPNKMFINVSLVVEFPIAWDTKYPATRFKFNVEFYKRTDSSKKKNRYLVVLQNGSWARHSDLGSDN